MALIEANGMVVANSSHGRGRMVARPRARTIWPAFCDNDIDGEVLRQLTSEDLRELGVRSVGHRRRLLDAIAALGTVLPNVVMTAAWHDVLPPAEAERRQLTVMFCDLGYTRSGSVVSRTS
jgi:hypothetical protein